MVFIIKTAISRGMEVIPEDVDMKGQKYLNVVANDVLPPQRDTNTADGIRKNAESDNPC